MRERTGGGFSGLSAEANGFVPSSFTPATPAVSTPAAGAPVSASSGGDRGGGGIGGDMPALPPSGTRDAGGAQVGWVLGAVKT